MITARQSRAARALLGWTQETLADKARISLTALKRLESENRLEVYEAETRPVLEHYGDDLVHTIDSTQTPVRVLRDVLAVLANLET